MPEFRWWFGSPLSPSTWLRQLRNSWSDAQHLAQRLALFLCDLQKPSSCYMALDFASQDWLSSFLSLLVGTPPDAGNPYYVPTGPPETSTVAGPVWLMRVVLTARLRAFPCLFLHLDTRLGRYGSVNFSGFSQSLLSLSFVLSLLLAGHMRSNKLLPDM